MQIPRHFAVVTALFCAFEASQATAAPSASQVCKKMIADGRGGGMSQKDCLCTYRVADAVLDDDLKALMFDAWYTGKNNMTAMEALPNKKRVEKQMRTMQRSWKKNCR